MAGISGDENVCTYALMFMEENTQTDSEGDRLMNERPCLLTTALVIANTTQYESHSIAAQSDNKHMNDVLSSF